MKTIEICGKMYPCRVTMGAMVRFKRASGRDVSKLQTDDLSDLCLFIWCCVASACNADKVEFNYDFDSFADNVELSDIQNFYSEMASSEKKTPSQP